VRNGKEFFSHGEKARRVGEKWEKTVRNGENVSHIERR